MIDASEDPERVGSQISLERARRAERLAQLKAGPKPLAQAEEGVLRTLPSMPQTPPSAALIETHAMVSTSSPMPPSDPEAAYRRARLGVVAVVVLVLLWVWLAQRRAH